MPSSRVPSYRLHRATGQAVVVIRGRSIYLGVHGTPESRAKYDRVIAGYLAARADPAAPAPDPRATADSPPAAGGGLLVKELVLRYWQFAKGYYRKGGRPTGEVHPLKHALRLLRRHFGETPAAEFGPVALKALREVMVALPQTRRVKATDPATGEVRWAEKVVRVGMSRRTVNKQVSRVKRVFGWGVAEELLPVQVHEALRRVPGLRKGRSAARETPRVGPAADEHVTAVLAHVPPTVRAMIEVQRLSGCRPQEVVLLRGADIDTAGPVWECRPRVYKSAHANEDDVPDKERVVFFGPRAQAVLAPFLAATKGGYLFRPGRPAGGAALKGAVGAGRPRDHYSVAGYRQEVRRGCDRAGVPRWVPLQLRHAAGTAIRRRFGLEAAQAVLGHAEVGVTQIYAEVDRAAARQVMTAIG